VLRTYSTHLGDPTVEVGNVDGSTTTLNFHDGSRAAEFGTCCKQQRRIGA
jgi:hypothetical protein